MHPWLNWIEHLTTDQGVRGSIPLGCARVKLKDSENCLFYFLYIFPINPTAVLAAVI